LALDDTSKNNRRVFKMNSIQRSPSPELFSSQEYSRAISEDRFFKLFDPAKVPHAIKVGDGLCVDENSMNACWIDDGWHTHLLPALGSGK
jgi:hypothetical protein